MERRYPPAPRRWHRKRPDITSKTPVHVCIRVRRGTASLRAKKRFRIVRQALAAVCAKLRFRLIEYSVMRNHLHLIAEADDTYALSRAMRSLSIRIAKRINQAMGARGQRIIDRYVMSVLETPLDVKQALQYVLNNYRRHQAQRGHSVAQGWIDPCSSALWFTGWSEPPTSTKDPCPDLHRGTVRPRSAALRHQWRAWQLIDPSFVPALTRPTA